MPSLTELKLRFDFPATWKASKYDEWAFYKNQFKDSCCGNKAVDFIARDGNVLWLIEVKDYRVNRRTKTITVWDEMAIKARDTLAGLVATKTHGVNDEQFQADRSLGMTDIHVVLHFEQPDKHSKLFPRVFDPAKVQEKIRQLVKPIDPHARVVELATTACVPWTVVSIP